jgi:F-type H+-transporting ATPase subunit epsilon
MQKNLSREFKLEIVSPYRVFYSGEAEMVVVNTTEGHIGIMKGHVPIVTFLVPGTVTIKHEDALMVAAIGEGYMEVTGENAYIVADFVEWPDEIDEARALAAKERAEERLRKHVSREEFTRTKAAMARALARLTVKKTR